MDVEDTTAANRNADLHSRTTHNEKNEHFVPHTLFNLNGQIGRLPASRLGACVCQNPQRPKRGGSNVDEPTCHVGSARKDRN